MKILIIIPLLLSVICKGQDSIKNTEKLLNSGTLFKTYIMIIGDTAYHYYIESIPDKPVFRKVNKVCIRKEK